MQNLLFIVISFYLLADCAKVLELDHDARVVYCETIKEITNSPNIDILMPTSDQVHTLSFLLIGRWFLFFVIAYIRSPLMQTL